MPGPLIAAAGRLAATAGKKLITRALTGEEVAGATTAVLSEGVAQIHKTQKKKKEATEEVNRFKKSSTKNAGQLYDEASND